MDYLPLCTGLFYESSKVLVLSPQYGKIVNSNRVTRDVDMAMYRGRGLKMFFKPPFKISFWLSYVFMITILPVTFISVYDSTSFKDWIFVLRGHKKVFDGMTSFQMYFNPIFLQVLLKLSLSPWW